MISWSPQQMVVGTMFRTFQRCHGSRLGIFVTIDHLCKILENMLSLFNGLIYVYTNHITIHNHHMNHMYICIIYVCINIIVNTNSSNNMFLHLVLKIRKT